MAEATVLVRPLHGLILDGIPARGAEIPAALATEWIADRLVEAVPLVVTVSSRPATQAEQKTRRVKQ